MAARYNPPPNWPAPPAGWTPPPGWQPDPAWGPPAAGWQLWLEDSPVGRSRARSLRQFAWPAGAAAALVVGIVLGAAAAADPGDSTAPAASGETVTMSAGPAPTVTVTQELAGPVVTETVTTEPKVFAAIDEGTWTVGEDVGPAPTR